MKKWWFLVLITLCWAGTGLVIFAGQEDIADSSPSFVSRPLRIVSTAPSLTEVLFALGLDEEIAGVTVYSDYPAEALEKPKIGTFWQPNIEAIIAAKPDLVVTLGFDQQLELAQRLKRIGCRCLMVKAKKVNDLYDAIGSIGTASAKEHQASELISGIRTRLAGLSASVGGGERVKVLWVVQREPLRVAGRDTFVNEMIKLAGGENAIGPTVHKYPPIGAEQVIASSPEVIIEPSMNEKDLGAQLDKSLRYWSKFSNVPAVGNERIYVIDGGAVSRLGPRLYEGVENIARCLWPELFAN